MIVQKVLTASLALLLALTATLTVVAQTSTLTREEIDHQRQQAQQLPQQRLTDERRARIAARCRNAQSKVRGISSQAKQFKDNHAGLYDQWKNKMSSFLARMSNNSSVDLSQLSTDLTALDGLVEAARAAVSDYETELNELADMNCASDPQAFADSLATARELHATARAAFSSIRNFIQTTIKADLAAIRETLTDGSSDGGS